MRRSNLLKDIKKIASPPKSVADRNDTQSLSQTQINLNMPIEPSDIVIRKYEPRDRAAVRRISSQTAFLDRPKDFVEDEEILADALTIYFTDYEPESSFVATYQNQVVGYLIGAKSLSAMEKVFRWRIFPRVFLKAIRRGILLDKKALRFFGNIILSFLKGEFFMPNIFDEHPAAFHINMDPNFRGLKAGEKLLEMYLSYLKENRIRGVYACTMSERAKTFMMKSGLKILYQTKRSYMRYVLNQEVPIYLLGTEFSYN